MKETDERRQTGLPGHIRTLQAATLLFFWGAVFFPVYPGLVNNWLSHSNNSHGMLVPFISLFLVWHRRDELRRAVPEGSPWGLAMLLASLLLYVIGYAGHAAFVMRLMIVSSLIGLVLYNWVWPVLRVVRFPLVFLFFMVPVPDSIYAYFAFPLQLIASKISAAIIQLVALPVYREGNMLYFAQTQLEVAEACSGLRSITSFIVLAALFAYMLRGGWFKRGVLLLLAIPLAMLVNITRIVGTGILAHFWGGSVAQGFLHEFSGMAVFALGFVLLACAYTLLGRTRKTSDVT